MGGRRRLGGTCRTALIGPCRLPSSSFPANPLTPAPLREWLPLGEHVKRQIAEELLCRRPEAAACPGFHPQASSLDHHARGSPCPSTQRIVVARKCPVPVRLE